MRLKDVGRVELGGETYGIDAIDLKGASSVGLAIYQLSGSNAIDVSNGVKDVLAEFEQTLPVGLGVQKIYDTTDFINQSIKGVTNSLRDAVILVVLILFLFLQNWKATLVPAIAIPVALIGTFALVLAFGFLAQSAHTVWSCTGNRACCGRCHHRGGGHLRQEGRRDDFGEGRHGNHG